LSKKQAKVPIKFLEMAQYQQTSDQPQVVIQQPVSTMTTVYTQQSGALRGWSSGLCDCFQDVKSCKCLLLLLYNLAAFFAC